MDGEASGRETMAVLVEDSGRLSVGLACKVVFS